MTWSSGSVQMLETNELRVERKGPPRRKDRKVWILMTQASNNSENELSRIIVDAAFHIHQTVGPGLLESVYEAILARDLAKRGLLVSRQCAIAIRYGDLEFDEGFRADLMVNDSVIVEVKSVER